MKLFSCNRCGNRLYFENTSCTRCGATLGFLPERMQLLAMEPTGDGLWQTTDEGSRYRLCGNYSEHAVCNWMVPADAVDHFCLACQLNRTIPDLGVPGNIDLWRTLESAKRRLVYSLSRLRLPMVASGDGRAGMQFDFLADTHSPQGWRESVSTGHADGLITINIAEADPAERERMRDAMDEPYRTLLGHFRHESGHYYWDCLIRGTPRLSEFRQIFGDETIDYGTALDRHYACGAPPDWQQHFVSAYASAHPWEDWAETWAHYLHIVDTLETAWQFGLRTSPRTGSPLDETVEHDLDPFNATCFEELLDMWFPLTFALNSLNRSMGHDDAYPFVLSEPAISKLGFVHRVVNDVRS